MKDFIYVEGKRVDKELPLRSLLFGEGVFETFRYKSKLPVHFDKHMNRLNEGAVLLGLNLPGADHIKGLIERTVEDSGLSDAYIKLSLLSLGNNPFYEKSQGSQVLIQIKEYPEPKGFIQASVSNIIKNSTSPVLRIKSFNYLENIIARREALAHGLDEALFLNEKGFITEGSAGNIFWSKDNILYTPSAECGLLSGTTREVILDIKDRLGLQIEEGEYALDYLLASDIAFFTNSLIGIASITRVDSHTIPTGSEVYNKIKQELLQELEWV